jgi:hypothetical protein
VIRARVDQQSNEGCTGGLRLYAATCSPERQRYAAACRLADTQRYAATCSPDKQRYAEIRRNMPQPAAQTGRV